MAMRIWIVYGYANEARESWAADSALWTGLNKDWVGGRSRCGDKIDEESLCTHAYLISATREQDAVTVSIKTIQIDTVGASLTVSAI